MPKSRHKYLGWRNVKGWTCIRCGACCKNYIIQLSPGEAMYYTIKYGPVAVKFQGKHYLLKKPDGSCIFLGYSQGKAVCMIYHDRPRVCRIYPFLITKEPLKGNGEDAEIVFRGKSLYLYVDAACPGVDTANNMKYLITPVLNVWRQFFPRKS
ncbi:MAG: YkgJ family cysteine cluster protein [Thermoproteales archaeon]|nr:YkgJ family cysteine cluster protein [Thermoproteales archaeon]